MTMARSTATGSRGEPPSSGEQRETDQERQEALARGKATSSVIGIRAMGRRFNVLMTIQVPLQQQAPMPREGAFPVFALNPTLSMQWETECLEACMDGWCDDECGASVRSAALSAGGPVRCANRPQQCCKGLAWHGTRRLARLVHQLARAKRYRACHRHGCHLQCRQRGCANASGRRGGHRRPREPVHGLCRHRALGRQQLHEGAANS